MDTPTIETVDSVLKYLGQIVAENEELTRRKLQLEDENAKINAKLGETLRVLSVKESSLSTMEAIVVTLTDLAKSMQRELRAKNLSSQGNSGVDFERGIATMGAPAGQSPTGTRGEEHVGDHCSATPGRGQGAV